MRADILVVLEIVLEDVGDEPAQYGNVTPGADLQMFVRHRRRAGIAGINRDELGAAIVAGLEGPLKSARVILGRVGPHDENDIGILDVLPVIGHRSATKRGGQTGHRGAMSYASLVVDIA